MTGTRALLGRFKSRLLRGDGVPGQVRGRGAAGRPQASPDDREQSRPGVRPENMVWIFGTGRTGSTWIAAMIEEMKGQTVWFEPRVGFVFEPRRFKDLGGDQFILSQRYKQTWLRSVRNFILDGADARFPRVTGPDDYLMIKEPAGSAGAPWLMEAMPESRMVLLIRDPRDVAASWLDAAREGGWQNERKKDLRRGETLAEKNPDAFVRRVSRTYVRNVTGAKEAYDAHKAPKSLVRYEELRADTARHHEAHVLGAGHARGRGGSAPRRGEARLGEHPGQKEGGGQVLPQGDAGGMVRGPHPGAGRDSGEGDRSLSSRRSTRRSGSDWRE